MKKFNNKGFTLTEILIVLVVAGILLALILPNVLKAIERGNVTAHQSNLKTIQTALFMCFTEKRDWTECNDIDQLVTDHFLEARPDHPFGGDYDAIPDPDGTAGYIACSTIAVDIQGEELPGTCGSSTP